MKHAVRAGLPTVSALAILLFSAGSSAAAVQAFSTPLQLPGSFGFGEPSIAIGSGRIVITAPNGLLTTATADQVTRVELRATLTDQDLAGVDQLATEPLDTEPLGGGVTAVPRA